MAIGTEIQYASVDDLFLDPTNPRLGRKHIGKKLSQERILSLMREWALEELATSMLESGYWPHEALLVIKEAINGKQRLIVVEGNRRLAALKMLAKATRGEEVPSRWREFAEDYKVPQTLLTRLPYIEIDTRKDVSAFLGFRHVTGIKEWKPAEKAEYIAHLIDDEGLDYEEVRKRIGSRGPTVRRHYISYRVLLQMDNSENVDIEKVEDKFSVLFLSLRTVGAQRYLHINIEADPEQAKRPVPKAHLRNLEKFALWLFGDAKTPPLFSDSRNVERFGDILESREAVRYLETADKPNFEIALRVAGGDEVELIKSIRQASDYIQLALSNAHQHSKSSDVRTAVETFGRDALQLLKVFPKVLSRLLVEEEDASRTNIGRATVRKRA